MARPDEGRAAERDVPRAKVPAAVSQKGESLVDIALKPSTEPSSLITILAHGQQSTQAESALGKAKEIGNQTSVVGLSVPVGGFSKRRLATTEVRAA
jgi:hypothetical protein